MLNNRQLLTPNSWINHEGEFLKGKHKGRLVEKIAIEEPSYLQWLLDNEIIKDELDVEVIKTCLKYAR